MKKVFATGAIVLALAGCAAENGEVSNTKTNGYELEEYVYQYEGNDLHCVGRAMGYNTAVLSCDFVRYHQENGASNG